MPYLIGRDESREKTFAHPPSHIAEIGVEPGMIVADFGSGSGAHVFAFAEAVTKEGRVYAIDVQRDLLTRIKNEAKRRDARHIDALWSDLELPGGSKLADGHVDIVFISNLFFQLNAKHVAFAEARRIVKPSGLFVIIERNGAPGLHLNNLLSKNEVFSLARRADFEPIREFDAGSHHFGIVFRPVAISLSHNV